MQQKYTEDIGAYEERDIMNNNHQNPDPVCHFCGGSTDDERYCFGCEVHVCADCADDENDPWGAHSPDDHPAADKDR